MTAVPDPGLNRRDFLRGTSLATVMAMAGGVPILAAEEKTNAPAPALDKPTEPPLKLGLIGCGTWGREILRTLARRPNAPVVALCDTYPRNLERCKDTAPDAQPYADFARLLDNKDVQAVVVATPSHRHRDIVLAALQAGKHVYCEAPLATTLDDARAITQAARAAFKVNFQAGLQARSDRQMVHLSTFIGTGVLGKPLKVRSQSHKKQLWRRTAPTPEREKELNWRLDRTLSPGLLGEIGIHQLDLACWFLKQRPAAVTGFGGLIHWKDDGRDVPDTVQAVFEFPDDVVLSQECTIANSFDADCDLYFGTNCAIMVRDRRAWMFNEADAPLLGWEVYARKDTFYKESGIVLGANATKITAQTAQPAEDPLAHDETPLSYSLQHFITNSLTIAAGLDDFTAAFGTKDQKALQEYLAGLVKNRQPAASWREGYDSTVLALKANEAVLQKRRIALSKEWFEIS